MSARAVITSLVLMCALVCEGNAQSIPFNPDETGFLPYLGQAPPGVTPERFAFDIILDGVHGAPSFSPDGKEVYWSRYYTPEGRRGRTQHIFFSRWEDSAWTAPQVVSFSGRYSDGGPCVAHDGRKLFFYSNRPLRDGDEPADEYTSDIWYVERSATGWGAPHRLAFNTDKHEGALSIARDGTLYFMSNRPGCRGTYDIFVAEPITDSTFTAPKNIGRPITSDYIEFSPCVSPDERYLVFTYQGRPNGNGLHISFRDADGGWSVPVRLDAAINAASFDHRFPGLSHDGKYFFFSREAPRQRRIYWVDAAILERHRE